MFSTGQLEEVRQQIEAELTAIAAVLNGERVDSVELDQGRVGRLSRMDAMQQQAMASGIRERLLMKSRRLEAALERLDNGGFGACCQCGEAIPPERLHADPGAPFCASCQQQIDERRRSA